GDLQDLLSFPTRRSSDLTVNQVVTTTSVSSSPNPSLLSQQVILTATVSASAATGTVTFKDGAATQGTGTLSSGVATFQTTTLTRSEEHTSELQSLAYLVC